MTLRANELVAGAGFVGYWQASSADCGDTIRVPGEQYNYLPWDNLNHATPLLNAHFDTSRDVVRWRTVGVGRSSYPADTNITKDGFS